MPAPPTPEEACERLEEDEDKYATCIERHEKLQQAHEECGALEGQERRTCMRGIIGNLGFAFGKFRHHVRMEIADECKELEKGSDEFRTCMQENRKEFVDQVKENHPRAFKKIRFGRHLHDFLVDAPSEAIDEIKACKTEGTRDEKLECIQDVIEKYAPDEEEGEDA